MRTMSKRINWDTIIDAMNRRHINQISELQDLLDDDTAYFSELQSRFLEAEGDPDSQRRFLEAEGDPDSQRKMILGVYAQLYPRLVYSEVPFSFDISLNTLMLTLAKNEFEWRDEAQYRLGAVSLGQYQEIFSAINRYLDALTKLYDAFLRIYEHSEPFKSEKESVFSSLSGLSSILKTVNSTYDWAYQKTCFPNRKGYYPGLYQEHDDRGVRDDGDYEPLAFNNVNS